jgi:hypothetical protein
LRYGTASALNLNVHVHALVVDGVYTEDGTGGLPFHAVTAPTDEEMERMLDTIARRIGRLLARRGVVDGGEHGPDRSAEEAPVLAGIADASVQGRVALGSRAGAEVRRGGRSPELLALASSARGPCHARQDGFDLHAAVVVPGHDRARLERICRYALRPPVAHDRIHLTEQGHVRLDLRHRWVDGTTHLLFEPLELLERLAALTPRPRINLVLYYGVLGARSAWRSRLTEPDAGCGQASADIVARTMSATAGRPAPGRPPNLLWAQLMQRSFGFDVLACPRCRGRLRLIAVIEDARVIRGILDHLGLPTEVPAARPSRAPPIAFDIVDCLVDHDMPGP